MRSLLLFAYYVLFVLDTHPRYMVHGWQRKWVYETAHEVAEKTDAGPQEGLRLMNIAKWESGYDPNARGKKGERGRWQIMPPARAYGAGEALWRMRNQGMVGYVGCRRAEDEVVLPNGVHTTCQKMIDDRVGPADEYLRKYPAPSEENDGQELDSGGNHLQQWALLFP